MRKMLLTAARTAMMLAIGAFAYHAMSGIQEGDVHAALSLDLPAEMAIEPGAVVEVDAAGRIVSRVCAVAVDRAIEPRYVHQAFENRLDRAFRNMVASVDPMAFFIAGAGGEEETSSGRLTFTGDLLVLDRIAHGDARALDDEGCDTRMMRKLNQGATLCTVTRTLRDEATGQTRAVVLSQWGVIYPEEAFHGAGLAMEQDARSAYAAPPACRERTRQSLAVSLRQTLGLIDQMDLDGPARTLRGLLASG